MRFMILMKASAGSEAGATPDSGLLAEMASYHDALARAGVLLDGAGLHPRAKGWRIRFSEGRRSLLDGSLAEPGERVTGYTLIQVRSREEAMEWSRRFPVPTGAHADAEIEVRQLFEREDSEPGAATASSAGRCP